MREVLEGGPAGAIGRSLYPAGIVDKPACVSNTEGLARQGVSPCGRCIAVCPVGMDDVEPPTESAMAAIRSYRKPS